MGRRIKVRFRAIQAVSNLAGVGVTGLLFLLGFYANYSFLKPVLHFVALRADGYLPSASATERIQRRLLNIPLFAGVVGLFNWDDKQSAQIERPLTELGLNPRKK